MSYRTLLTTQIHGERLVTGRGHSPFRDDAVDNALATHVEFADRRVPHGVQVIHPDLGQVFALDSATCSCHAHLRQKARAT